MLILFIHYIMQKSIRQAIICNIMYTIYNVGVNMKLRILEILKQKGKTKYWLYIQLGLSYQNFNKIVNNQTTSIKFENLKAICDILECTPNDLFEEYFEK